MPQVYILSLSPPPHPLINIFCPPPSCAALVIPRQNTNFSYNSFLVLLPTLLSSPTYPSVSIPPPRFVCKGRVQDLSLRSWQDLVSKVYRPVPQGNTNPTSSSWTGKGQLDFVVVSLVMKHSNQSPSALGKGDVSVPKRNPSQRGKTFVMRFIAVRGRCVSVCPCLDEIVSSKSSSG